MVFNFPPFNSCFLQSARHLGMMVPLIYCMQRTAKITCKVELIDFPHVVSELRFSGEKNPYFSSASMEVHSRALCENIGDNFLLKELRERATTLLLRDI